MTDSQKELVRKLANEAAKCEKAAIAVNEVNTVAAVGVFGIQRGFIDAAKLAAKHFNEGSKCVPINHPTITETVNFLGRCAINYDCDDGPHGTHSGHCRACNAKTVLGKLVELKEAN